MDTMPRFEGGFVNSIRPVGSDCTLLILREISSRSRVVSNMYGLRCIEHLAEFVYLKVFCIINTMTHFEVESVGDENVASLKIG
jgi:hypothetical protein